MDNRIDIFSCGPRRRRTCIGRCVQCGAAIYSENDVLSLLDSGDLLHADCWDEYIDEHMFDYVEKLSTEGE